MGLEEHIKALWYVNVLQYMLSYWCQCSVPSVLKYFVFTGSTIYKVNSKSLTLLYFNLFYLFSSICSECGLLNSTMMKLNKCIILMHINVHHIMMHKNQINHIIVMHILFFTNDIRLHVIYVLLLKCAFRVSTIQIY